MIFKLPSNADNRADALNCIVSRGKHERAPFAIEWAVNHRYLQGARSFDIRSWEYGQVDSSFESEDGQLFFRHEDVLIQYQRMLGTLLRMGFWPYVSAINPLSINSVRDAAMGQVILDEMVSRCPPEKWRVALLEGLLQYGTMGLGFWIASDLTAGQHGLVETIPPWQLVPLPVDIKRPADEGGLIRHMKRPYFDLRDSKPDWKLPAESNTDLELQSVSLGLRGGDSDEPSGLSGYTSDTSVSEGPRGSGRPDESSTLIGDVIECWQYDVTGDRIDEYTVVVGKKEVHRVSYRNMETKKKPLRPVAVARCLHADSWYGRPWVSPIVAQNRENEQMLANLFQNVKDLDLYPATFIPAAFGVSRSQYETTERPRVFVKEEDYTTDRDRIETIAPANTGDAPGRTVAFGQQQIDRMSNNSPLFRGDAPGRVESAAGLGVLWETMGIGTIPISNSAADATAWVYKVMLTSSREVLGGQAIQLRTVDDRIMGVTVNQNGEVEVDASHVPEHTSIRIDIEGRNPKMVEERRQNLLLSFDKGIVDIVGYHWLNETLRLDLPTWDEQIADQIRTCMLRNIIQWGDGTTPGAVRTLPYDDHELMLRVIKRVVRRPAFERASAEVREAFYNRIAEHEAALGRPSPLPNPEDAAAQSAALAGQFGGGAPPAGGLPPQLSALMEQASQGAPGGIPQ